ncbi:restriction endonuclease subunit S [Streptomyces sp. DSM 44917]|uniref:Restriction endonuclease subunit S n=1 Tax=Streptomyces boetiae TaxID=3075541 RepID=A0ABU2L7S4_9ACTN|nr:restriction endonuclease subunit S [Streptomyces sp. DSM 44917]MDT0307348.1 restriction endonuclease subunit S [Streptomyces sp. DSM 44917]
MAEWRQTTLDQLVKLQRGHDLPTSQRRAGSVPVMGAAGQSGAHDTAMAKAPGVVLGRAGASMGKATYCDTDFWPLNTALYVTDFQGNDPRFTYYLLDRIDFSGYNSGAAQPMLNRNYITQIRISLPEPAEQRAIAVAVGALDDKVEINKRVAYTAESLCRGIFSEQSQEARIPVGEIAVLRKGQVVPENLTEVNVAHYSLPAFDSGAMPEITDPRSIKSAKFAVRQPSVLLSKLNPEIPRVWNVSPDRKIPALASTEFLVLEPQNGVTTAELWAVLSQPELLGGLAAKVTGTSKSHQRVRPDEVMNSTVVDPRVLGDARGQAQALVDRAMQARNESRGLADLRDTLLPQLMSGKLRVRDAEKIVEDAV